MGNVFSTCEDEYIPIYTTPTSGIMEIGKNSYRFVDVFDSESFLGSKLVEFYGSKFIVE